MLMPLPYNIAIELLHDHPYQPRSTMDEESLQQLSDTIQNQGFQGALVARPHPAIAGAFQLTAGHRRRDAARRAGLRFLPVQVQALTDREMITLAITENIQREDLTPLEEGKLFQRMVEEMGLTQTDIAIAIKKDRRYVYNRLQLAQAPLDIQEFASMKAGNIKAITHLLKIADPAERAPIIQQLLDGTLNTENLPAYIQARTEPQAATTSNEELAAQPDVIVAPVRTSLDSPPSGETQDMDEINTPELPASTVEQEAAQTTTITDSSVQDAQALSRKQTAKLHMACKHMTDFASWLHEQHIPLSDIEREALMQHEMLIQHILQTY